MGMRTPLPSGLTLGQDGSISGIPNQVGSTNHTITGSNNGGSAYASLNITTIHASPDSIDYEGESFTFSIGQPVSLAPAPQEGSYRMVSQSGSAFGTIDQPIGSDFWHPQRLATDNRIHDNCRELRRLSKRVNPNRSNRPAHLGPRIHSTIIRPLCRRRNPHNLSFMGWWQSNLLACQPPS